MFARKFAHFGQQPQNQIIECTQNRKLVREIRSRHPSTPVKKIRAHREAVRGSEERKKGKCENGKPEKG
jgi:hypothetical protein